MQNNIITFPNQNVVTIHREKVGNNFLQVSKKNFYDAYRDLNAHATMLWLYLAGNMDGYNMAFSPKAVHNDLGMPITTVSDQKKKLIAKGYLVQRKEGSNVYDFYERPQPIKEPDQKENEEEEKASSTKQSYSF